MTNTEPMLILFITIFLTIAWMKYNQRDRGFSKPIVWGVWVLTIVIGLTALGYYQ